MRALVIILGGLLLLAMLVLTGLFWNGFEGGVLATRLFAPIWLVATTARLAMGISAGRRVREEISDLLVTFCLPAACSGLALWLLPCP